eukprot:jgi/Tetstr1/423629/TSEL_001401.t1
MRTWDNTSAPKIAAHISGRPDCEQSAYEQPYGYQVKRLPNQVPPITSRILVPNTGSNNVVPLPPTQGRVAGIHFDVQCFVICASYNGNRTPRGDFFASCLPRLTRIYDTVLADPMGGRCDDPCAYCADLHAQPDALEAAPDLELPLPRLRCPSPTSPNGALRSTAATSNDDDDNKAGHCGGWPCENTNFRAAPDGFYCFCIIGDREEGECTIRISNATMSIPILPVLSSPGGHK